MSKKKKHRAKNRDMPRFKNFTSTIVGVDGKSATLADAAPYSLANCDWMYGTDNREPIQNCINFCAASGVNAFFPAPEGEGKGEGFLVILKNPIKGKWYFCCVCRKCGGPMPFAEDPTAGTKFLIEGPGIVILGCIHCGAICKCPAINAKSLRWQ